MAYMVLSWRGRGERGCFLYFKKFLILKNKILLLFILKKYINQLKAL
jgi:hypothetical protein